jgi:hypothetical protein
MGAAFAGRAAKELMSVRPKRYIDLNTGILTPYSLQDPEAAQHDSLWQQKQKKEKNKEEEHKETTKAK